MHHLHTKINLSNPMKTFLTVSLALLFTLALRAEEKEGLVIEVPAAVKTTLLREAGAAGKIVELRRENEQGKTKYEATLRIDGREYKAEVDAQGELHHLELRDENAERTRMTVDQLPPVVRSLFAKVADEKTIKDLQRPQVPLRHRPLRPAAAQGTPGREGLISLLFSAGKLAEPGRHWGHYRTRFHSLVSTAIAAR